MSAKQSFHPSHSHATAPYRLSLRRLFLRLSRESGVIPSRLFLRGISCARDDIPYGNGQFAEVFKGQYNDQEVALKRLRVYQNERGGAEDRQVSPSFITRAVQQKSHPLSSLVILQRATCLVPVIPS